MQLVKARLLYFYSLSLSLSVALALKGKGSSNNLLIGPLSTSGVTAVLKRGCVVTTQVVFVYTYKRHRGL